MSFRLSSPSLTRRTVLRGGVAYAAYAFSHGPLSAFGFAEPQPDEQVVPFLDPQQIDPKKPALKWEELKDWITPSESFFDVSHYGTAKVAADAWRLKIEGHVEHVVSLSLDEIKSRPQKEITATLECSGNGASAKFMGAIGNARWTGAALAPLLAECGMQKDAVEVVFWGADQGKEKIRDGEYMQHFARSLSLAEARREDILLAYAMNGEPLSAGHGFPLRLIVPGWYGVAWVKWLSEIEVSDQRLMNRFMARDYVTIRGHEEGDQTVWRESSVGPMNAKSLVARVVRQADGDLLITGAAWTDGTPMKSVELKLDDGDWQPVTLDSHPQTPFAWTFWSYRWKQPPAGEHRLVSRATDERGRVQPAADDPSIRLKKTYWEANAQVVRRIKL